jgi:hypothetical protein
MLRLTLTTVALAAVSAAGAGSTLRVLKANGVSVVVPDGWAKVVPAPADAVTDPRSVLVVGTDGVTAKLTVCQIAAYRIPPAGAVVVIVRWKTATSGGGRMRPGRRPLKALASVRRPSFECFKGRGASASLALGGHAYQVNVLVGDRASGRLVAQALAVGRSFRLAR